MDRYLFITTFILLVLEAGWFLGDLGIVNFKFFSGSSSVKIEKPVGKLTQTKRNVRRRNQESIVWEESASDDSVYNHDSVLTLSQSSATLELENQTKIALAENTLIMVELPENRGDSRIRLRFSKGDIKTRASARAMQITTKSFTIDASAGAELNLRSVGQDNVEVEVLKGTANLKNEKTSQDLAKGDLALLSKDTLSSTVKLKEDLKWITPDGGRAYTHAVPVGVILRWEGAADILWHLAPDGTIDEKPVAGQSTALSLNVGSHNFRLKSNGSTSNTMQLNVWKAPVIHLLSPLPRDRLSLSSNSVFSWVTTSMAKEYRIQLSHDADFSKIIYDKKTSKPNQEIGVAEEGDYFWRVEGIDDKGYVIPAPYKNQIFNYQDLLEAPTLKAPRTRTPAKVDGDGASYRFIDRIFELFVSSAHAETSRYDIEFEWEVVAGADHYVVEIDREGNFQKPLTVVKVQGNSFLWRGADLGSYFWRVAAGRGTKMGRFSQASILDMNKAIRDSQVAKDMGVTIKKAEAPPAPVLAPAPTSAPAPVVPAVSKAVPPPAVVKKVEPVKVITPTPAPLSPIVIAKTPSPPQPVKKQVKPQPIIEPPTPQVSRWSKTKLSGKAQLGTAYEMTSIKAPDSVQSEFNGLIAAYGHIKIESSHPEKSNLLFHSSFSQNKWQPKSAAAYPFQAEVSTSAFRNSLMLARQKYYIGAAFSQVSIIERATFDALIVKELWLYGAVAFFRYEVRPNLEASHEVSLSVGSGVYELYLQNSLNYFLLKRSSINLLVGADLNLGLQSGRDRDGTQANIGATLGLSW